jgi:hypothetical protein
VVIVTDNRSFYPNENELKTGEGRIIFLPTNIVALYRPVD